jgi:hypothetical protein
VHHVECASTMAIGFKKTNYHPHLQEEIKYKQLKTKKNTDVQTMAIGFKKDNYHPHLQEEIKYKQFKKKKKKT